MSVCFLLVNVAGQSLLNVPQTQVTRLPSGLTVATEDTGGSTCTVRLPMLINAHLSIVVNLRELWFGDFNWVKNGYFVCIVCGYMKSKHTRKSIWGNCGICFLCK